MRNLLLSSALVLALSPSFCQTLTADQKASLQLETMRQDICLRVWPKVSYDSRADSALTVAQVRELNAAREAWCTTKG